MVAPPNRGRLNSAHIYGTHVPVEEPSTASKSEQFSFAIKSNSEKIAKFSPIASIG
jgi:hypothetical protein